MSTPGGPHCGHTCCDEPHDPFHDHFLDAADCCAEVASALRAEVEAARKALLAAGGDA